MIYPAKFAGEHRQSPGGTVEGLLLWMILGAIELGIFVALTLAIHNKNPNAPTGQQIAIGLGLMIFCAFGGIGYMLWLLTKTDPQPAQQPQQQAAPQAGTP